MAPALLETAGAHRLAAHQLTRIEDPPEPPAARSTAEPIRRSLEEPTVFPCRPPTRIHAVRAACRRALPIALLLAACGAPEEPPVAEIRPVRTITVEDAPGGETVTLTGRIEAQEEVRLAFRVGQRMIERKVNVGDRVEPGQLIARLESTTLQNAVQGARANLASAQAAAATMPPWPHPASVAVIEGEALVVLGKVRETSRQP